MIITDPHIDHIYARLVEDAIIEGTRKENRTGVDTLSTFGLHYNCDLRNGDFPLLTTKKISWKNIVTEVLWFLSGQTDISILKRHGCGFWDAWADEEGKVPSAYGNFWRHFPTHGEAQFNDQIAWVLNEMKRNPMSRRLIVNAWAPGNAQTSSLPPCHCLFVFNVQLEEVPRERATPKGPLPSPELRQRLCLHLTQRSCDLALGVPYNIATYALILHLFSRFSGIEPGVFSHTLVDAHVYTSKPDGSMAEYDHVPGLQEQLAREPRKLPKLVISPQIQTLADVEALMDPAVTTEEIMKLFQLEGYDPHPNISFKVAV